MNEYKLLLEIVKYSEIKEIQKKLNQWITTDLLIDFKTEVLNNEQILFIIKMKK